MARCDKRMGRPHQPSRQWHCSTKPGSVGSPLLAISQSNASMRRSDPREERRLEMRSMQHSAHETRRAESARNDSDAARNTSLMSARAARTARKESLTETRHPGTNRVALTGSSSASEHCVLTPLGAVLLRATAFGSADALGRREASLGIES
jgi:hypothetical protein